MLARLRKSEDHEGGFTLIELLVVMIIIGILAAIAIPAFLSQKKKGYEASQKSDLRAIATEISTALVDNPATVTVTPGTNSAVVTAAGSPTPATLPLSPGNSLTSGNVTPANGTYCVAVAHSGVDSGNNWQIAVTSQGGTQTLSKGQCAAPAAPAAP
ncbi:MAG: secretory protein [Frankiales bacterium]|jgi:type IV pilus assembly protein PilA|nr:secretory protein [Frankiales bacterium]